MPSAVLPQDTAWPQGSLEMQFQLPWPQTVVSGLGLGLKQHACLLLVL